MLVVDLPTDAQRRALCEMIADALVDIRFLANNGEAARAAALADAFHEVPREMYGWGTWSPREFRGRLAAYQSAWPLIRDYLGAFDAIFPSPPG